MFDRRQREGYGRILGLLDRKTSQLDRGVADIPGPIRHLRLAQTRFKSVAAGLLDLFELGT